MDYRFQFNRHKVPPETQATRERRVQDNQRSMRGLAYGTTIPMALLSGPLGGYFLGSWLDAHFHWQFATILLIVLFTAGSFALVIEMLARLSKM